MIKFECWSISTSGGLIGRQYDNLSGRLEVIGSLPEGWEWAMIVQVDDYMDIISLLPMDGGVGAVLNRDQLSIGDRYYTMQLRGTLGNVVRHTNAIQVFVPKSLSGDGQWPELPTEFTQAEQRTLEAARRAEEAAERAESAGGGAPGMGGGGTTDHAKLINRDAAGQHPMSAITGLEAALTGKQPVGSYLTKETDPTVPAWAKQEQKPAYTASEVGADPTGTAAGLVSTHNTDDGAHQDLRLALQGLSDRLNAALDSDDATLDELSEIVAYIKSNKQLIDTITTSKVSVSDIVNNLTTNAATKPLSAAQGVALKALIDALSQEKLDASALADAVNAALVQAKESGQFDGSPGPTGEDGGYYTPSITQAEGSNQAVVSFTPSKAGMPAVEDAVITLPAAGGTGGGASEWELINEVTTTEEVTGVQLLKDLNGQDFDLIEGRAYVVAPDGSEIPNTMWYFYTAGGTVSLLNYGLGLNTHIEFYRHKLADMATLSYYHASRASTGQFAQKIGGYVFNQFRVLNWDGKTLPVGTRVRLIGRRV